MDQSTTPKPVMDVTPPKPAATASSALASHQSETVAAPQSGSDRNEAAPASPATPAAEADQSPAQDLPQATPPESGMISEKATDVSKESLAVHTAPPLNDEDKTSAAPEAVEQQTAQQKPAAHTDAPRPHGPAAAITAVILGMLLLSALAILIYLNS